MTIITLHNGQSITAAADQLDDDSLVFVGTGSAGSQSPFATFAGSNSLGSLSDLGSAAVHGYGAVNLMTGSVLTINGLTVGAATLLISERPGASVIFNGTSRIVAGSTLTASGYGGTGTYAVNGTMSIDGSSTVNMDSVAVNGIGTLHLTGESALLRVGNVGAGETIILDGGMLSLTNGMHFLGTITDSASATSRIGPISSVNVYNTLDAVRETFDRTTGVLDLFNAQGTEVANLKFAGAGDLYAAPTSGLTTNYIAITSHPSTGGLPVTFTT